MTRQNVTSHKRDANFHDEHCEVGGFILKWGRIVISLVTRPGIIKEATYLHIRKCELQGMSTKHYFLARHEQR